MSEHSSTSGGIGGIGIGAVLAVVISYTAYHSVLWAILHGLAGWFFVIWYVIFGGG